MRAGSPVIAPGATLGMLGGGQLGRMFALAAAQLGYNVWALTPEQPAPIAAVCQKTIYAAYNDESALSELAVHCPVVTVEFENIPAAALEYLAGKTSVRPGARVLAICQNRLAEKNFLQDSGIDCVPFIGLGKITDDEQMQGMVERLERDLGYPCVIKTAGFGYDGKGQCLVRDRFDLESALQALSGQPLVAEAFIDFAQEISVIGARQVDGSFAAHGPIGNEHKNHILDISLVPASVEAPLAQRAVVTTQKIMETLDCVGLLCVEFFVGKNGQLYVNELAPRPHNSGHYSLDAGATNQFEQHVRAVTGLPLGDTEIVGAAAMANLLGDLWQDGPPDWSGALSVPGVHLHLYGKSEARPGRKMGHLTARAGDPASARSNVLLARQQLRVNTASRS